MRARRRRHGLVEQARRGTQFPYVVHVIRVAEILERFRCGEDVVVAGFLHDKVEDVASAVALTLARTLVTLQLTSRRFDYGADVHEGERPLVVIERTFV